MASADRVLLLGDINIDLLLELEQHPSPGEDSLARSSSIRTGGGAANTAAVLARLGARPVLLGRVGSDPLGDFALEELRGAGVDISCVGRDERFSTGVIVITVVPGGERTMFSARGANPWLEPGDISPTVFSGAGWLHLVGYAFLEAPQRDAARRALSLARQRGLRLSLDTSLKQVSRAHEDLLGLIGGLEVCVLGMDEARELFGLEEPEAAVAAMRARGVGLAAVKLGSRGAVFGDASGSLALPAFPVASVDTTGAGDAFTAGLIFGQLGGLSLAGCAVLAGALGALATTVRGGGAALPAGNSQAAFLEEMLASRSYPELEPAFQEALLAIKTPK